MRKNGIMLACVATLAVAAGPVLAATSVFKSAPNDPRAVTVKAKGDGRADDTDAIQQALDRAAEHGGGEGDGHNEEKLDDHAVLEELE